MKPWLIATLLAPLLALGAPVAFAQSDDDEAKARKLFEEGRALMVEPGKLDQACDTLAGSYALRPRGDVLLNLAECHRRQGKTATAWREFDEAIRYAKEAEFQEAIATAERLRDELAAKLSRLTVVVPKSPAPPAGLEIVLDGKPLPAQQWGVELFVDPGPHAVTASAAGHEPFSGSTEVKDSGDPAQIVVSLKAIPPPPKKPEPPKPAPKPAPPAPAPSAPLWSWIVGGAGVAMLGVSIGTGIDLLGVGGELDDRCGAARDACPRDYDFAGARQHELTSFGLFVGFGAGGIVAVGAAVTGIAVGLSASPEQVAIVPLIGPDLAGVGVAARLP